MKKIISVIFTLLIFSFVAFAETKGNIPDWMGKSSILLSEYTYGSTKTINDLFSNPKSTTTRVIESTENQLKISHVLSAKGAVIFKLDVTFKMSRLGESGTCFASELYYEIPATFESMRLKCSNPRQEPEEYGQIMGLLQSLLLAFYD